VDIHGLVGAAQYNGCEGRVLQGPNEKGRWEVQVEFQCEERTVSLKPDNLQPKPTCGWELAAMSLAYSVTESDVSQAFATCGMVRSSRLAKNPDGSSKGICMVEMAHKSGAEAAMEKLQGYTLKGRALKVDWSLRARQEIDAGKEKEAEDAKKPRPHMSAGDAVAPAASPSVPPPAAAGTPADAAGGTEAGAQDSEAAKPAAEDAAEPAAEDTAKPAAEDAAKPAAEEPGSQRRRRSAWDTENCGGVVYTGAPASGGASAPEGGSSALPPEAELSAMPTKELRRLLADRGVNVSTCFEKADLLEQARLFVKASR